jgi:ferredoxin-NADP reductase
MNLTVIDVAPVAANTIRIGFTASDGGELPAFKPGAHIELCFAGFVRRYSLTSSPLHLHRYEICALRARPGRGGSEYLHDRLRVGDRLVGTGPFNAFALSAEASDTVFIAGGIGITPFLPMMEALVRSSQRFDLHYAARTADRFLPVPEHPGRTCRYVNDGGRSSMDIGAILSPLSASVDLYVCGPRRLIEAVRTEAGVRGWPDKRVHFETFGTGFDPDDRPVKIHLAQSGSSIEVQPGTAILDALLEAGVWAPYECRRGQCASCMTEVLSGTPEHRDLCLTEQQRRRAMCTCVSWSRTAEIVLNL